MKLANAAQLKSLYNAGKLNSSTYYWAAEANSNGAYGAYLFSTYSGNAFDTNVYDFTRKAVCVGK